MNEYKILDIGIGRGGRYIDDDPPHIHRIGIEQYESDVIKNTGKRYGIETLAHDVVKEPLPFNTQSIDEIDLFFPHQSLFTSLCLEGNVWQDFRRVLRPQGGVYMVFDSINDRRILNLDNYHEEVLLPQNRLSEQATRAGFNTEVEVLEIDKLKKLGTVFSRRAINRSPRIGTTFVYHLLATHT